MWGTLKWRLNESLKILLGKKNPAEKLNSGFLGQNINDLPVFRIENKALENLISATKIEFIFSEFGERRTNAGGNELSLNNRLNPTLKTLQHYFPNAEYTVYSDFDLEISGVVLKKVLSTPISDKEHERYGYRTADYFKFKGLLESKADFKCAIDSDMFVISPNIFSLVYLTKIFAFCAPKNSRNLLKEDMKRSLDSQPVTDESLGFGHSYNQSPMTLWNSSENGKMFYEKCCELMLKEPSRASLVMWKAARETGFSPYLLPEQWCVCGDSTGIGNEILLHVGHKKVMDFYKIKF